MSLFSTRSNHSDSPHIRKKNEKVCGGEYIYEKARPFLPKYASAWPRSRFRRQSQKQAVNDSLVRKLAAWLAQCWEELRSGGEDREKNAFTDCYASDLCKGLKFTTLRETGGADGSGKRRREL